ncbi:MAG: phospho-N-acetylmuramoyl-pentapeptide-transferase [Spirochaetes bacterium]|nr:phospho-N-acetylmuramoyl-pentapeptide-transferase [Spirochaetota bacterium]
MFYPLRDIFFGFNLFKYITFRAAYATITSLIISFMIGKRIIKWLRKKKFNESVREDTPDRHKQKKGTPSMGGIIILISAFASILLWARLDNVYIYLFLFVASAFGILGFIDDYIKLKKIQGKGLHMRVKFTGEFVISSIVLVALYFFIKGSPDKTKLFVPFVISDIMDMGIFYILFGIIILLASSNAVNLTDGLDGLAIGCSILTLASFTAMAYLSGHYKIAQYLKIPFIQGSGELSVFGAAFVGASLGFLWYNAHPAEVFMGDTGALSLGGLIGIFAIVLKKEVLLIMLGGIFVLEALSVIIQVFFFKTTGKRVFKMAPLHHHYELKGVAESKIIIRLWIIGLIFTLVGMSIGLKIR